MTEELLHIIPIQDITINKRFREPRNIPELANSIKTLGLLHPIGITSDKSLIFGRRRLEAFKKLGHTEIPCRILDIDALQAERDENEQHLPFTMSERVAIGKAIEEMLGDRRGSNQYQTKELVQNIAQAESGTKSRQIAAKQAGFNNHESYRQAVRVVEKAAPELVEAVDKGEISISAACALLELPQEEQKNIAEQGHAVAVKVASDIRQKKPHVSNNSGNNEWYTPCEFIEAARNVMGGIDCDPASSDVANKTVKATKYFTAEQNGLEQTWEGNVWMNPPYANPLVSQFSEAITKKFTTGEINQACVLVNNATETGWFRKMAESSSAICFTGKRVKFLDPDGNPSGAPLQGQAIIYLGSKPESFANEFSRFGYVFVGRPITCAEK